MIFTELEIMHVEQLNLFMAAALEEVWQEQLFYGGSWTEDIGAAVHQQQVAKDTLTCDTWGTANARRKQICEGCFEKEGQKKRASSTSFETKAGQATINLLFTEFVITTDGDESTLNIGQTEFTTINDDLMHELNTRPSVYTCKKWT